MSRTAEKGEKICIKMSLTEQKLPKFQKLPKM